MVVPAVSRLNPPIPIIINGFPLKAKLLKAVIANIPSAGTIALTNEFLAGFIGKGG